MVEGGAEASSREVRSVEDISKKSFNFKLLALILKDSVSASFEFSPISPEI